MSMSNFLNAFPARLLDICLRLNLPRLAAFIFIIRTKRINRGRKYKVLCLERSIFMDDVHALTTVSDTIEYLKFPKVHLKSAVKYFLPFENVSEKMYHNDPLFDEGKKQTYKFISRLMGVFRLFIKFDAVLAGNYSYLDQQELFRYCKKMGIPVIVLYKEGMIVTDHQEGLKEAAYDGKYFIGDRMLVYSETIKDMLLTSNIKGLLPKMVHPVGIPRMDIYINQPKKNLDQIVFFSFYSYDKFFYMNLDPEIVDQLNKISEDFHRYVFEFAKNNPSCKVIVKTKFGKRFINYVNEIAKKYFPSMDLPNLTITNTADTPSLILESRVVLGFNSTALLEAIAADKLVVTPYFGEVISDRKWDYFSKYPKLVQYARDYPEMEKIIFNYQEYAVADKSNKEDFLSTMIYKVDGQAGQRVQDQIITMIENN